MATELGQPLTKQEEVQQHTPCTRILISSVRDLHQSQATCYNKAKLKSSCSIHRQTLSCTSIQTSLAYGILKTLNHTTRVYPCLLMKPGHFREKKKNLLANRFYDSLYQDYYRAGLFQSTKIRPQLQQPRDVSFKVFLRFSIISFSPKTLLAFCIPPILIHAWISIALPLMLGPSDAWTISWNSLNKPCHRFLNKIHFKDIFL